MTVTGYLCCSAQRRYMRMQHLGEVGGIHSAGAGADRDDRRAVVVLAVEQRLHLELADDVFCSSASSCARLVGGVLVVHLVRELDEHLEVVEARARCSLTRASSDWRWLSALVTFCAFSVSSQRSGAPASSLRRAISA